MKLILRCIKPYRWLCAGTILVMILDVAGGLLIPTIAADMINVGIGGGNLRHLLQGGARMLAVTVVTSSGGILGGYLSAVLSAKVGRDLRNALYDQSLTFSETDFERFGTGSMITRTLNDVNVIQQGIVWFLQMVLPVPAVCLMGIFMAFSIDVQMGWLLIGVTALILALAVLVTRKASVIFDRLQKFLDRMNVVLRENVTGVRVIRAFHKEAFEEARMRKSFEAYAESAIKANRLFAGLECIAVSAINLCVVLILWLGGNRIGAGVMEIGDITALTQYAVMILFYIVMAQMVMILVPRAMICVHRISEVLHHTPEIQDIAAPDSRAGTRAGDEVVRFQGAGFRYADGDEMALENLEFCCRRGETTAIVGSTGSGKSTIAKLILRFHDATSGAVLFQGRDVRQMPQKDLRARISYVPQKAWLFSGTIAENLRYGDPLAEERQMEHALAVAQAGFVEEMPDGLLSGVSQGGTNFSGGQKQRLAIARALMKRADLYLFDDSFSALDFKTDAALRKALADETKNAAVLIIAQRISTIMNAEQIVVLENGRIAGIGRHDALMKTCRVYQDIARSQMKGGGSDE